MFECKCFSVADEMQCKGRALAFISLMCCRLKAIELGQKSDRKRKAFIFFCLQCIFLHFVKALILHRKNIDIGV